MAVSPDLAFWGSKMQVAGLQAWRLPISESQREPLTQTVRWHAWGLGTGPMGWKHGRAKEETRIYKVDFEDVCRAIPFTITMAGTSRRRAKILYIHVCASPGEETLTQIRTVHAPTPVHMHQPPVQAVCGAREHTQEMAPTPQSTTSDGRFFAGGFAGVASCYQTHDQVVVRRHRSPPASRILYV